MNITVNSNVEFNAPLVMPRFQTRYGTGIGGVKDDNSSRSWGPKLTEARYFGYNPRDDYFQTGVIGTESVSFSTGSEKNQTCMLPLQRLIQKVSFLTTNMTVIISTYAILLHFLMIR